MCHIKSNRKKEKIILKAGSYHWDAAEVELFCSTSIILSSAFVFICFEMADKKSPPQYSEDERRFQRQIS